jgi:hypothetical protein
MATVHGKSKTGRPNQFSGPRSSLAHGQPHHGGLSRGAGCRASREVSSLRHPPPLPTRPIRRSAPAPTAMHCAGTHHHSQPARSVAPPPPPLQCTAHCCFVWWTRRVHLICSVECTAHCCSVEWNELWNELFSSFAHSPARSREPSIHQHAAGSAQQGARSVAPLSETNCETNCLNQGVFFLRSLTSTQQGALDLPARSREPSIHQHAAGSAQRCSVEWNELWNELSIVWTKEFSSFAHSPEDYAW